MSGRGGVLLAALRARLKALAESRGPDQIIGTLDDPYLLRWYVIPRNRWLNIYLHHFMRSDDDRALHDHPWWNASLLLEGSYVEHSIEAGGVNRRVRRVAGQIKARGAKAAHRIDLDAGPCWTLFITGPRIRQWGFHCPQGWRHWRVFTSNAGNVSSVGRGCGEDDAPDAPSTPAPLPSAPPGERRLVERFLAENTRTAPGKTELLPSLFIAFTTWAGGPALTRAQFYAAIRERGGMVNLDGVEAVSGLVIREDGA